MSKFPLPKVSTFPLPEPAMVIPTPIKKFEVYEDMVNRIASEELHPRHVGDPLILKFINHYLQCRNHKQAARLTGLNARDGMNLLERKDIRACIIKITQEALVKHGYDAEEVVERVKEIGFSDPIDIQSPDGYYYKNLEDIPPETRRAIKSMVVKNTYTKDINGIEEYSGEIIEIKFHDKMKALDMLGREKGLFKKTVVNEHEIGKNASDILLKSAQRSQERIKKLQQHQEQMIDVTPEVIDE